MRAYVGRALRLAVATAAVVLCSLSPAQAAKIGARYDPQYGFPFEVDDGLIGFNLGFRGKAVFDVPDECIPPAGSGLRTVINVLQCRTALVESAFVELYDVDSPGTTIDTLVFQPSDVLAGFSPAVVALFFDDGIIDGLFTLPSLWVFSEELSSYFSLQFVHPFSRRGSQYSGPILYSKSEEGINRNNLTGEGPYELVYSVFFIPEPGTLALAAGALLAAGGVARSRRRTRSEAPLAISGR